MNWNSILLSLVLLLSACAAPAATAPANPLTPTCSPVPEAAPRATDMLEITTKTAMPTAEPSETSPRIKPSLPSQTVTVTPNYFEFDYREPTVIFQRVTTPTLSLDPKSYLSVLDWIKFSFANQNISIIEDLALEKVLFGISGAEYTDSLTKDELIETLSAHLAPGTQCLAYTFRGGEINSLDIFMANWEPDWEYQGRKTNDLLFHFSDQFTPDSGLSFVAVEVPNWFDQDYVTEEFEHLCFD